MLKNIDSRQFTIKKIERISKRVTNDKNEFSFVPTQTCKVFFEGQDIPQHVYLWNVRIECQPYIRKLRQCLNCLRFGHISNNCRGVERCRSCGVENHISKNCTSEKIVCANCKGHHNATDRDCPERNRQYEINTTMATRNLSFAEASLEHPKMYNNKFTYSLTTSNRFDSLFNYNEEFPILINESQSDLPVHNNTIMSRVMTSKKNSQHAKKYNNNKKHQDIENNNSITSLSDIGMHDNQSNSIEKNNVMNEQIILRRQQLQKTLKTHRQQLRQKTFENNFLHPGFLSNNDGYDKNKKFQGKPSTSGVPMKIHLRRPSLDGKFSQNQNINRNVEKTNMRDNAQSINNNMDNNNDEHQSI